jgi:hypothetical protein
VRVSALVRGKSLLVCRLRGIQLRARPRTAASAAAAGDGEEEDRRRQDQRVVADKLPLTLDRNGQRQS